MKAAPLLIAWHNDGAPVWSAHFEPNNKGRLATSGGDGNVRLWRVEDDGDGRKVTYLSTLVKHTAAVNVVRFAPKGETLATAGDDGNTLLWVPTDHKPAKAFGDEEEVEDKETWRVKHMCRSQQAEVYDLAWSPDARYFMTGSMDNIARIYDASTGSMVRQIAEHNHFVQGVAWDPLNEYVATQSSDRSIHIYSLRTKDGEFALKQHNKITKVDLPARRISNSPAPPDNAFKPPTLPDNKSVETPMSNAPASPAPTPSIPGTPSSLALPMNPPQYTHSRRSSFGSPSVGRSASPAPSMPLPAVRPMEHSPIPFGGAGLGARNAPIYANEAMTTFFRRLTFAPDGCLLFTPAGQFKTLRSNPSEGGKPIEDIRNTVYIYTRAGLSKPPVAHLPGHKKPSIAVRCAPVFYKLRTGNTKETVQITLDTSSNDGPISALPASVVPSGTALKEPSPTSNPTSTPAADSKSESQASSNPGPAPVFALPYRIIYAVATQDTVLVYDTQQQTPLCVATNLHLATFTDLTWSPDGLTLLISSSDGFCSALSFAPEELGERYTDPVPTYHHPNVVPAPQQPAGPQAASAGINTKPPPTALSNVTSSHMSAPSPISKSRSNSASSVATQASTQTNQTTIGYKPFGSEIGNNPAPTMSQLPGITASNPSPTTGSFGLPSGPTPPMTPSERPGVSSFYSSQSSVGMKRQASNVSEKTEDGREMRMEGEPAAKKKRITPTLVKAEPDLPPPPAPTSQ